MSQLECRSVAAPNCPLRLVLEMPQPLDYAGNNPLNPSEHVPWWLWAIVATLLAAVIFYLVALPAYELRQDEREKNNRHGIHPG